MIKSILVGQCISLLNTSMGLFTTLLVNEGKNTPLFQLSLGYFSILIVYSLVFLKLRPKIPVRTVQLCALSGVLDSLGFFLSNLGFRYTSFVNVYSLQNLAVVVVMLISYFFLHKRFNKTQILGATVCLMGLSCVVFSDLWSQHWKWEGKVYGDVLVIGSAIMFAL